MNSKNKENSVIGVVLCGGNSMRMGSDKGLLQRKEEYFSEFSSRLLRSVTGKIVFSVNTGQLERYKLAMPDNVFISDKTEIPGPFRGIVSVSLQFPESDLFVLACDMQEMKPVWIETLFRIYQENNGFEFYVYRDSKFIQTLCGIYTHTGIKRVYAEMANNQGQDFSLKNILGSGNTKYIAIEIGDEKDFMNYNSPEELQLRKSND